MAHQIRANISVKILAKPNSFKSLTTHKLPNVGVANGGFGALRQNAAFVIHLAPV